MHTLLNLIDAGVLILIVSFLIILVMSVGYALGVRATNRSILAGNYDPDRTPVFIGGYPYYVIPEYEAVPLLNVALRLEQVNRDLDAESLDRIKTVSEIQDKLSHQEYVRTRLENLLMTTCAELRSACGIEKTPAQSQVKHKLDNPRPGDLVYETSSLKTKSIGYLILDRTEFVKHTKEDPNNPDEPEPDTGYQDHFWYIETLDGELQRWSNCEFRRILEVSLWTLERGGDLPRTEWVEAAIKRHDLS